MPYMANLSNYPPGVTDRDIDAQAGGTHICPDCEELVADDFLYHTSCCPHEDSVETSDIADGVVGNGAAHVWYHYCHSCGAEVYPCLSDGWDVVQ